MKKIFDTDVLHVTRARKRQFNLTICPFILHEFESILAKTFSATKQKKENAVALITEAVQDIAAPSKAVTGVCRESSIGVAENGNGRRASRWAASHL